MKVPDNPQLSIGEVAKLCDRSRQSIYFAILRATLPAELVAGRYLILESDALAYKATVAERVTRRQDRHAHAAASA